FVIGRTLTILSWDNPVTAFFRKSRKLRHSLGRPSCSDFVQFQSYGEIESNRRFVVAGLLSSIFFAKVFFEISIDSDVT
ncbi:MAG: hypothetical protein IJD58_13095, partial [Lachnospiraceae bacterium]|nr:hypothetical protein [Lachnospiraceae bacterium]